MQMMTLKCGVLLFGLLKNGDSNKYKHYEKNFDKYFASPRCHEFLCTVNSN